MNYDTHTSLAESYGKPIWASGEFHALLMNFQEGVAKKKKNLIRLSLKRKGCFFVCPPLLQSCCSESWNENLKQRETGIIKRQQPRAFPEIGGTEECVIFVALCLFFWGLTGCEWLMELGRGRGNGPGEPIPTMSKKVEREKVFGKLWMWKAGPKMACLHCFSRETTSVSAAIWWLFFCCSY